MDMAKFANDIVNEVGEYFGLFVFKGFIDEAVNDDLVVGVFDMDKDLRENGLLLAEAIKPAKGEDGGGLFERYIVNRSYKESVVRLTEAVVMRTTIKGRHSTPDVLYTHMDIGFTALSHEDEAESVGVISLEFNSYVGKDLINPLTGEVIFAFGTTIAYPKRIITKDGYEFEFGPSFEEEAL